MITLYNKFLNIILTSLYNWRMLSSSSLKLSVLGCTYCELLLATPFLMSQTFILQSKPPTMGDGDIKFIYNKIATGCQVSSAMKKILKADKFMYKKYM